MTQIVVERNKCCGCEACVAVCPVGAITMPEGKALIDDEQCVRCGACINECPMEAVAAADDK